MYKRLFDFFLSVLLKKIITNKATNKNNNKILLSILPFLRLDTDWYKSTKHELIHLFPKISKGGVLIIDDYGFWQGAKQAVDEYISENNIKILLNRIDHTGRIAIKQ